MHSPGSMLASTNLPTLAFQIKSHCGDRLVGAHVCPFSFVIWDPYGFIFTFSFLVSEAVVQKTVFGHDSFIPMHFGYQPRRQMGRLK